MGMMFGAEKLMKSSKETFFDIAENGTKEITEQTDFIQGIKNLATKALNTAATKFSKLSKGGQTATKVGIGLLFVAGSITAYSIGKTIGKKLTGRDETVDNNTDTAKTAAADTTKE